ncbi:caveolin-1-like [Dreissena polymorpha]|uniref:Caveolin n=1 Tax=Dreissena polymorpha TaxID=45954 RepID=A0A9D4NDN0_DREPO|nr:caveolin-1-like [Dreissena polymorpha]KAH3892465.1 hypothetical protein DPMN_016583 [Dreissena polymorpha]
MVDLVNRDPNQINTHLQCQFEDVLAEPDGTHSIDCVWKLSYLCFNCWKGLCYNLLTLLCGICIASEYGISFAYISFLHIWFYTPCFKVLDINCGCLKKMYSMCVSCCLDPLCQSCGLIFSAFKK